jgi:hypothetical protein
MHKDLNGQRTREPAEVEVPAALSKWLGSDSGFLPSELFLASFLHLIGLHVRSQPSGKGGFVEISRGEV